jgi:hypothetical protein
MSSLREIADDTIYRLVLILPEPIEVLVISEDGRLPAIQIPYGCRVVRWIQRVLCENYGLDVVVINILRREDSVSAYVFGEVLGCERSMKLKTISIEQLFTTDVDASILSSLSRTLNRGWCPDEPFAKLGWIHEAISWVELKTRKQLAPISAIEQYGAGVGHALVRLRMNDGSIYWFKAVAGSEECELPLTQTLHRLYSNLSQ